MSDALGTAGGVVSAVDHRLAQAGLIAPQSSSVAVRTGVLYAPGAATLVTGTAATGTMTVSVAAHHWVTTRGTADGVYLGCLPAATTVNIAAAPGANSRIDVVYVKQNDAASTISPDGSTGDIYGVQTGTAAASPTKPAIPVGALELATVTVAAGATATNGAGVTISNTAPLTVARGARLPVRSSTERNALTQYADLEVYRLDTGQVQLSNGSAWATAYDPTLPLGLSASGRAEVTTTALTNADTALTAVVTVPAVAVASRITVHASGRSGGAASARTIAWDFDSLPASATNVTKDDPANRITADASTYATVTASLSMDLPANVAGTFRLMYRANGNGFNFGGLIWTRGPVV